MKSFISIFLIVFCGLALSWYGLLVKGSQALNTSELKTSLTVGVDEVIIPVDEGLAARGKHIYQELGCALCHTQQVRRPGYGSDWDREWGARQSVARDYLLQDQVLLGNRRLGPDLSNVGSRYDAEWFLAHLYNPQQKVPESNMPRFDFLFEEQERSQESSSRALSLDINDLLEEGHELVPSEDAVALVAYLQSLKQDYDLPESKQVK